MEEPAKKPYAFRKLFRSLLHLRLGGGGYASELSIPQNVQDEVEISM